VAAGGIPFMSITSLQAGVAGIIAVVGVTGFVVQAQTQTALRQEVAALTREQQSIAALRAENVRLERTAVEVAALREDDRELARLRDEATALARDLSARDRRVRAAVSAPPSSTVETVRLSLPDADLSTIFSAYQIYSGRRVVPDPSIAGIRRPVRVIADGITREEAMELIRATLLREVNVVLESRPDGTLLAKRGPAR
jgi:hypothetical protein